MKNSIKKFFMVAMVALFGLTIPVYAATITVDSSKAGTTDPDSNLVTNTGSITIENVNAGDSLSAYKIIDAYYNSTTNTITYEFTDSFKAFLASSEQYGSLTVEEYTALTGGSITSGESTSKGTLDVLASSYAAYIKKNAVTGVALTPSGTVASVTTAAGSYLILPTATARIYAVMVGNVAIVAKDGAWEIEASTIVAKVSEASLTKKADGKSDSSYNIGDEITYTITGTVPQYPVNAINKTYKINDTMSAGLTFSGIPSMTMQDGEEELTIATDGTVTNAEGETVATIAVDGQKLTITVTVDNVNSTTLKVSYKATLNENAMVGSDGVKNNATLTYSNSPYDESASDTTTPPDGSGEVTIRTYGINILKHDVTDKTIVLSGARFEVYSDSAMTKLVTTVTTGPDGTASIKGVKAGTYYLKETASPAGYSMLKNAVTVTIDENDTTLDNGYKLAEIPNTKVSALPITGGMGTIIFTVTGAILMVGASWFIFVYRKKNRSQEV